MKQILILAAMAALLSSCSVHRASVISTSSATPMKTTTTVASLDVAKQRISYTYTPTRSDAKRLSENQLIDNAMYMALQENGNGDVLVKVNFYVTKKTGLFSRRIQSISVSGYPAKYVDFRQPSEADYTNFERLPQGGITDVHAKTSKLKRLFGPRKERKRR